MILHQETIRGSVVSSHGCPHRRGTRRRGTCRDCKPPKERRWQTEPPFYLFVQLLETTGGR